MCYHINKKYDFIFDRSSNITMLYSAKNYDISDLVLKSILRSEKLEKLNLEFSKESFNPELEEKKKEIEEKNPVSRLYIGDDQPYTRTTELIEDLVIRARTNSIPFSELLNIIDERVAKKLKIFVMTGPPCLSL